MNAIQTTTWSELLEVLFADSWRPDIRRYRSPYAFRGQGSSEHGLATSLSRLGGDYARMEGHLLRNFRKYASTTAVEVDSTWDWLSMAKHHGLPTRLLDWTFSPYVAMHFATEKIESFQQDGSIWMVDFCEIHKELPPVLRECLDEEGSDVFTAEMLADVAPEIQDFDQLNPTPFALFFEPPSLDARIVNQFALFSLMSDPTASMEEWLEQKPSFYRKVIIPAELKWEIRDKLDQANITERVLFPGLDGLSAWLRRQYSQRPDHHE